MTYSVQPGDTLIAIARKHGCSLRALLDANPQCEADPDRIGVGQILALPPAEPAPVAPGPAPAPAEPVAAISERAIGMIVAFEVSSQAEYERRCQHPLWPGLQSGVTIGIGYDVGQNDVATLRAIWEGHLPPAALERLAPCCGVTGERARALAMHLRDIAITWEAADFVFRHRDIAAATRRTWQALPHCDMLSPDSLGALVSLVFNRGASFALSGERYTEMRAIRSAMERTAFGEIPDQIRAMKRLWRGVPGAAGLLPRRDQEAALFADGLAVAAPAPSGSAVRPGA